MDPDKDLANDLMFAMTTLTIENALLKTLLATRGVPHIEKLVANAKTDRGMIQGALQSIAQLHAELKAADTLDSLAERYRAMHLDSALSDNAS